MGGTIRGVILSKYSLIMILISTVVGAVALVSIIKKSRSLEVRSEIEGILANTKAFSIGSLAYGFPYYSDIAELYYKDEKYRVKVNNLARYFLTKNYSPTFSPGGPLKEFVETINEKREWCLSSYERYATPECARLLRMFPRPFIVLERTGENETNRTVLKLLLLLSGKGYVCEGVASVTGGIVVCG